MKSFVYTLIQKCDHQNKKDTIPWYEFASSIIVLWENCFLFHVHEVKAIPLTLGPAGPGGPGDPWAPYG